MSCVVMRFESSQLLTRRKRNWFGCLMRNWPNSCSCIQHQRRPAGATPLLGTLACCLLIPKILARSLFVSIYWSSQKIKNCPLGPSNVQNRGQKLSLLGILHDDEETSQAAGDGTRED